MVSTTIDHPCIRNYYLKKKLNLTMGTDSLGKCQNRHPYRHPGFMNRIWRLNKNIVTSSLICLFLREKLYGGKKYVS